MVLDEGEGIGYSEEHMKQLLNLAVAVWASVAAGQEAVPTVVEGATYQFGNTYAGLYADAGHPDGGNITISAGEGGQDMSLADIIGNWNDANNERAYWGTVTMTGGEVHDLYGAWCPRGDAGHSTVIMQGGTARNIIGGQTGDYEAYNNTVIMTGGTAKEVTASSSATGAATFNNIYLIGKGGEATIDDVHYTHTEDISIKRLYGATGNDLTHNAIDFYGTGINVGRMDNADILAFLLSAETSEAILNLTLPLDLVDVTLNFSATATPAAGTAITLISTPAAIYLTDEQLARTYTITDGSSPLTTARLSYTAGVGLSLLLAPEPSTTTLALLSLTFPSLRRRRRRST